MDIKTNKRRKEQTPETNTSNDKKHGLRTQGSGVELAVIHVSQHGTNIKNADRGRKEQASNTQPVMGHNMDIKMNKRRKEQAPETHTSGQETLTADARNWRRPRSKPCVTNMNKWRTKQAPKTNTKQRQETLTADARNRRRTRSKPCVTTWPGWNRTWKRGGGHIPDQSLNQERLAPAPNC